MEFVFFSSLTGSLLFLLPSLVWGSSDTQHTRSLDVTLQLTRALSILFCSVLHLLAAALPSSSLVFSSAACVLLLTSSSVIFTQTQKFSSLEVLYHFKSSSTFFNVFA